MRHLRALVWLPLVLAVGSCTDRGVREYVAQTRPPADDVGLYQWLNETVLPALRAYCELERNVYDRFHAADVPNLPAEPRRYCPPGGTDPVPPPQPPPGWEDL